MRASPLPRERITTAIHDGLRFTAMSFEIRSAVARATLFGLASISILALLPIVVRDQLASRPIVYGILLAGFGSGAFVAGMSNGFLRRIMSQNNLVAVASVACATCCLSLALTSSVAVAAFALALGGAGWLLTWTGIDVSVQLASPRWVVGRTLSIYYALSAGGMAAGRWVWGTVAQNHSLTWALEGAAAALLLVAAAGILFPVRPWEEARPGKFGFPSARTGTRPEAQEWPDRCQGRVFNTRREHRGVSGLYARQAPRSKPRRRPKLDPPAQSANAVSLDPDIPYANLDGLSSPKPSAHCR